MHTHRSNHSTRALRPRGTWHKLLAHAPAWSAALTLAFGATAALDAQKPREDIVEVPAIGDGLCVSNTFQSNMVIQRDKPIAVWGWAAPGEQVTVRFAGDTQTATAGKDRNWKTTLAATGPSTEPRQMTVQGASQTLTLDNILVGDVWVLGGQSNMEFELAKVENGSLEIVSAHYPQIRILTVPFQDGPETKRGFARLDEWSSWFGRHFRKGYWDECSPETARELSAIGYVFARRIHMASQVPIGVIDASRGGTTVETWTPAPVLRKIDSTQVKEKLASWDEKVAAWNPQQDLEERIKRHNDWVARQKKEGKEIPADRVVPSDLKPGPAMDQNRPGNCYASMIGPIEGLSVKGAIFHQGYNNCFDGTPGAIMYRHVFPEMIKSWRAAFNDPAMPFGILSLCTEGTPQSLDNYTELMANAGPHIREAQYQTFLALFKAGDKNIGFTSTYDLRRRWYHPQLKVPAGERIARWALATQYGFEREIRWRPPLIKDMTVEGDHIVLEFDENVGGVDDGGPIMGFAVAGEDRKFHPAETTHFVIGKDSRGRPQKNMKKLVLRSHMVPNPVHYRYAWARSPLANVQSHHNTDIPLPTQRSDSWTMAEVPRGVFGEDPPAGLDRGQRNQIIKALRQVDLERRLQEAGMLIEANTRNE